MLVIGIILIVIGVFTCALGILQNTILFALFADTGAQLARFHNELDFHIAWLFFGPGTVEMIVGIFMIVAGIVFIVRNKKRKTLQEKNNEANH